jgi:hypothetical protein
VRTSLNVIVEHLICLKLYVQHLDMIGTLTLGLHGINMKVRTSLNIIIEHFIPLEIICANFRLAWITHTWFT